MKNKKRIALMWVLSLIPLVMVALAMFRLPEQVPTHWDLDGQVTYSARSHLWWIAAVAPLSALLFQILPKLDPKRENYDKFRSFYELFAMLFPLFITVVLAFILVETFRPGVLNVGRATGALVSALLLALGAFAGKVKANWFFGFRTPWAISDPDVWNKTQRLGGWIFFLTGLVGLPLALLAPVKLFFGVFMGMLLLGIVLAYFMSWKWYWQKQN